MQPVTITVSTRSRVRIDPAGVPKNNDGAVLCKTTSGFSFAMRGSSSHAVVPAIRSSTGSTFQCGAALAVSKAMTQAITGRPAAFAARMTPTVWSTADWTMGADPIGKAGSVNPFWKSTTTTAGFSPKPTGLAPYPRTA